MVLGFAHILVFGLLAGLKRVESTALSSTELQVKPFTINLSKCVGHMNDLITNTLLPDNEEYPGVISDLGIPLYTLKNLQKQWLSSFDWEKEQDSMNKFQHYTTTIEGLTVHFIHEKSMHSNAIPLIMNHGWPGSFLEFVPVIEELTKRAQTLSGKPVSFHVVVPSLPGFAFSSSPPQGWTADRDTARIFNTLMVDVLGYKTYATLGTDWGSAVSYGMYEMFNKTCRAGHFAFLPYRTMNFFEIAALNISLNPLEMFEQEGTVRWNTTGTGYYTIQTTKPNTIGLALYDNPVGQLAWIGEKFLNWSDPNLRNSSFLTDNEILRGVSLYYLTKSFNSALYIYAQNPNATRSVYTKARTDAPMLFSAFKYNPGFWPKEVIATTGNLVFYQNHNFGGHFPGLEAPAALIEDAREIGTYWTG